MSADTVLDFAEAQRRYRMAKPRSRSRFEMEMRLRELMLERLRAENESAPQDDLGFFRAVVICAPIIVLFWSAIAAAVVYI